MSVHSRLDEVLNQRLQAAGQPLRLAIAYSGGLDSTVLLHLACRWQQAISGRELLAIHVQHGLSPNAEAWFEHCQQTCAEWGVAFEVCRLQIQPKQRQSLENLARQSRYAALLQILFAYNIQHFCTAHHQQDQAETFLLQAMRGAGVAGLRGMGTQQTCAHWQSALPGTIVAGNFWQLRPLLDVDKTSLLAYAQQHGLRWIEDESNQDLRHTRNFLRKNIFPQLMQLVPNIQKTLSRSAAHCRDAAQLLQEVARADIKKHSAFDVLNWQALSDLSLTRRRNALRFWVQQVTSLRLTTRDFEKIWGYAQDLDLPEWSVTWKPATSNTECQLRYVLGNLFYRNTERTLNLQPQAVAVSTLPSIPLTWRGEATLALPLWQGEWQFTRLAEDSAEAGVPLASLQIELIVTGRQVLGRQRIRLHAARPAKTFKQWCQELRIDEKQRKTLPCLWSGKNLLVLAGLGMVQEQLSLTGVRYRITWRRLV